MLQPVGRFDDRDNRRSGSGGGFRGGNFNRGNSGGGGGGFRRDRQMYSAVCSNCGKDCQIPFRPTNNKPVYCSECFEKMNGGRDGGRNESRPRFNDRQSQVVAPSQNNQLLENINNKLDRILKLMEQKPVESPVAKVTATTKEVNEPVTVKSVAEEVKPSKVEKASKTKKKATKKDSE